MRYPKSISRSSLALVLILTGLGDGPPAEPVDNAPLVRPSATVIVELDAPIYDGRLENRAGVMRVVSETLLALLDSAYRYVEWVPRGARATQDTVVVRIHHDVNTANDVVLELTVRGGHASPGDTTRLSFESVDLVWTRTKWDSSSVAPQWVRRLREVTRKGSVQLIHEVFVHLPLAVQPQVTKHQVTIPMGPKDIGADAAVAPEFKLHVTVIETGLVTTQDPADLFLATCRSGAAVYVCRARVAIYLGDTLRDAELEQKLADSTLTIRPASLHVWSYTPDRDPRVNGMIPPGGGQ